MLTSLVDWVFGHICYVLSRILRESKTVRRRGGGNLVEVKGRFRIERLKKRRRKR